MSLRKRLNQLFPAQGLELPEDNRVFSLRLPGPLARTISLVATDRGKTRSALVREILEDYLGREQHADNLSVAESARGWLADRAYQEWYRMYEGWVGADRPGWRTPDQVEAQFRKYLFQLDKMFNRRGLHHEDVDWIVDQVARRWRQETHGT
jgi:predicted DNA-binding protein